MSDRRSELLILNEMWDRASAHTDYLERAERLFKAYRESGIKLVASQWGTNNECWIDVSEVLDMLHTIRRNSAIISVSVRVG